MASETSPLPSLVGISRFGIAAEVQEAAAASGAGARLSVHVHAPLSPPPRASKPELDTRFDLVVLSALPLSTGSLSWRV